MKQVFFPNDLEIAPVALGAMNFGISACCEDAFVVLDA